MEITLLNYQET